MWVQVVDYLSGVLVVVQLSGPVCERASITNASIVTDCYAKIAKHGLLVD